jgi:hypothetical protein
MGASLGIFEMELATGFVKGSAAWATLKRVADASAGRHGTSMMSARSALRMR